MTSITSKSSHSTHSAGDLPVHVPVGCCPSMQRPDIDGFRYTACVDWLEVEFRTMRPRNPFWLKKRLACSFVQSLSRRRGSSDTRFRARFQDPSSARAVLTQLKAESAVNVLATGIEVSADMTPLTDVAYASMELMATHCLRGLKNPQEFARFGHHGPGCEPVQSFARAHQLFAERRTCYLGHDGSRHTQRIYVKTTDDGGRCLPREKHRVRIENTYFDPEGLPGVFDEAGLRKVVGTNDFSFRRPREEADPLKRLLIARSVQLGARAPRAGRVMYARNTQADTSLNRSVADAMRTLNKRWTRDDGSAQIADRIPISPEGAAPASNNYTSISFNLPAMVEVGGGADTRLPDGSTWGWNRGSIQSTLPSLHPVRLDPITKWEIAMTIPVWRNLLERALPDVTVAARMCFSSSSINYRFEGKTRGGVERLAEQGGSRGVYTASVYTVGGRSSLVTGLSPFPLWSSGHGPFRCAKTCLKCIDECFSDLHSPCVNETSSVSKQRVQMDPGSLRKARQLRLVGRQFVSTPRRKAWISKSNVKTRLHVPMNPRSFMQEAAS